VSRVVSRGIDAGGFPGAAVVIGTSDSILLSNGFGRVDWSADAPPVSARYTRFDVASLTKVIATTSAMMLLVDDGRIKLDDPISRYLPEFSGGGRERVTIRQALEHRAGLPPGPDFRGVSNPAEARRALLRTPLIAAPGARTLYSDVGPMLLGVLAGRVSGMPLDVFVRRRVFSRIGMTRTGFGAAHGEAAPTQTATPGIVHDRNARAMGGVAGHAGLFATAEDVALFAQLMLGGGSLNGVRVFSDSTVAEFTSRQAGSRALGWETCRGSGSCGHKMNDAAFGHTGFTGTSLWIDPVNQVFAVVLTNEVNEPRAFDPVAVLSDVRADVADLAVLSLEPCVSTADVDPLRAERAIGWYRMGASPRVLLAR
jgi:CubicO group peptidase (beta-lactamase class C family)